MGLRILITNDHVYWDQDYIEKLFYALREAGHNVVVSAPNYILPVLENEAQEWLDDHFGTYSIDPQLDGYPMMAAHHGLEIVGPQHWGRNAPCDLVIAGIKYGWTTGEEIANSGTTQIAFWAAVHRNIPAIAVSAMRPEHGEQGALWGRLVTDIVNMIETSAEARPAGEGLLPRGEWLNVNLPYVGDRLPDVESFAFMTSEIDLDHPPISPSEVVPEYDAQIDVYNADNLPSEQTVLRKGRNRISISTYSGLVET